MAYTPDGVFAAMVTMPSASTLSGPVVDGVTLVVEVVATTPAKVSFVMTVPDTVVGNAGLVIVVAIVSVLATIGLLTVMFAVAVAHTELLGETWQIS